MFLPNPLSLALFIGTLEWWNPAQTADISNLQLLFFGSLVMYKNNIYIV